MDFVVREVHGIDRPSYVGRERRILEQRIPKAGLLCRQFQGWQQERRERDYHGVQQGVTSRQQQSGHRGETSADVRLMID
jgi:hypothetical protein